MAVTRVFRSGNSQAVRIPREFWLDSGQVEILRRGGELVIRARTGSAAQAFRLLASLSDDFFKGGRKQPKPQKRPLL